MDLPAAVSEIGSADLTVLTYNVRGLPWPAASGRAKALRRIGGELAALRADGRAPDVVLVQEGFRGEMAELAAASGYRYWAQGPGRSARPDGPPPPAARGWRKVAHPLAGEGLGKVTGAGLHILSDLPIDQVRGAAFRYCAGIDCLANKGVMLARLSVPGLRDGVEIANTHMNARRAARAPADRTLKAHNLQTDELLGFLARRRAPDRPLLIGGDFNVRNAPERYDYGPSRPYKVVAEYCHTVSAACAVNTDDQTPWLRSQDLQGFAGAGQVQITPVAAGTLFDKGLSDHAGYLVRYRLTWTTEREASPPVRVRPQIATPGLKVTVSY